jgi:beta-glucosidase
MHHLSNPELETRIDQIMQRLTLQDKVGQMSQFAIDVLSEGDPYNLKEPHTLSAQKMYEVLTELRAGSILNVGGHAYSREHWHAVIGAIQEQAMGINGIPVMYGIDAIHGTNYTLDATLFPQQIGLAATWNTELVESLAAMAAYETRASAIPWNFSPVCDLGRDPRWSRFWEGFGEDVLLASEMAKSLVRGYEGNAISDPYRVASCLKHYMGYSIPLTGKDRTQAWIPEGKLREYFMPPFHAAIAAGAHTIMINSGEVNGVPAHASKWLLTELLRREMGFEGIAVTDWEDITYLVTRHRVADDYKAAIAMAINAGVDMAMVPHDLSFPVLLRELVEEGTVPMERIDEAVRRILLVKLKLGLFERPVTDFDAYPLFGGPEHAQLAYDGACESITLLRNDDGILPLNSDQRILVAGPTADNLNYLNGGWTWTWQGDDAQYHPEGKQTVLGALRSQHGEDKVTYVEGADFKTFNNRDAIVAAAEKADVAILCIGEPTYTEKPGDIPDLNLPEGQVDFVQAVAGTGTPVVLVLLEGRPRIISRLRNHVSAVVHAYLPGNEGGRAIAAILLGQVNPSGKLPFTYPSAANSLIPYDHKGTDLIDINAGSEGFSPEFPFGHGLSYTSFTYSNLRLSATEIPLASEFEITVDVTNSGGRQGKQVIQLYISDLVASITPPVKRLRGFQKMAFEPGETKTIRFTLHTNDLAFVGRDNEWVTEPGSFVVQVGGLEQSFNIR